jgi:peroxiredoxin
MTLQDELDAFKSTPPPPDFPQEFGPILGRTISSLIASGQAERALRAGDNAPPFELPDQDGVVVSSAELLKQGPVVVSFYRGVWCPFCNIEMKALQAALGDIQAWGATLVAISQQTQANNRKSRRQNDLNFAVLSDKGGDVGAAFGLRWVIPEEMREVHRRALLPKAGGPAQLGQYGPDQVIFGLALIRGLRHWERGEYFPEMGGQGIHPGIREMLPISATRNGLV